MSLDPPWGVSAHVVLWWEAPRLRGGGMVRYLQTPVGPYDEAFAAVRHGLRFTVRWMAVTSAASRGEGRRIWALPKELAAVAPDGACSGDGWRLQVEVHSVGPTVPVAFALPLAQGDRRFRVSGHGRARLARVRVQVDGSPPLTAGIHPGIVLSARLRIGRPKRRDPEQPAVTS